MGRPSNREVIPQDARVRIASLIRGSATRAGWYSPLKPGRRVVVGHAYVADRLKIPLGTAYGWLRLDDDAKGIPLDHLLELRELLDARGNLLNWADLQMRYRSHRWVTDRLDPSYVAERIAYMRSQLYPADRHLELAETAHELEAITGTTSFERMAPEIERQRIRVEIGLAVSHSALALGGLEEPTRMRRFLLRAALESELALSLPMNYDHRIGFEILMAIFVARHNIDHVIDRKVLLRLEQIGSNVLTRAEYSARHSELAARAGRDIKLPPLTRLKQLSVARDHALHIGHHFGVASVSMWIATLAAGLGDFDRAYQAIEDAENTTLTPTKLNQARLANVRLIVETLDGVVSQSRAMDTFHLAWESGLDHQAARAKKLLSSEFSRTAARALALG
jgi:hypothetical protein